MGNDQGNPGQSGGTGVRRDATWPIPQQPALNSALPQQTQLFTLSCVGPGACTAGGSHVDRASHTQALVVTQSHGRWGRGAELRLPANAATKQDAQVTSIACQSAGNCVAVGLYASGSGANSDSFMAADTNGTWSRAQQLVPPSDVATPRVDQLFGVSCSSHVACQAAGDYIARSRATPPMVVTERNGHWGRAAGLSVPRDAATPVATAEFGISCPHAGDCAAVGGYDIKPPADTFGPLALSESNGLWRRGVAIALPADALAGFAQFAPLEVVSCATTGFCAAVGEYALVTGQIRPMALTGAVALSGRAIEVTALPRAAGADPSDAYLLAVACASAGRCVAVGGFKVVIPGVSTAMSVIRVGGQWGLANVILPPADAVPSSSGGTFPESVSCLRSGYCVTVGFYSSTRKSIRAMAAVMP